MLNNICGSVVAFGATLIADPALRLPHGLTLFSDHHRPLTGALHHPGAVLKKLEP